MESYSQVVLFFVHKNEPGGLHACMKAHSANAHQQVIWLRGVYPMRVAPDGWKGELNLLAEFY